MAELEMQMATAKNGTWKALNATSAVALAKLMLNGFVTNFSAKTDGSYFLIAEGSAQNYVLLLVAPDNSINFSTLMNQNVVEALETVRNYVGQHPIPGWAPFIDWFFDNMTRYIGSADYVTVCGNTVQSADIPAFPTVKSQYNVFDWLKKVADTAGCSNVAMSSCQVGNYNKFEIPVTAYAFSYEVAMKIQMAI